jgi:hypothetical protein
MVLFFNKLIGINVEILFKVIQPARRTCQHRAQPLGAINKWKGAVKYLLLLHVAMTRCATEHYEGDVWIGYNIKY